MKQFKFNLPYDISKKLIFKKTIDNDLEYNIHTDFIYSIEDVSFIKHMVFAKTNTKTVIVYGAGGGGGGSGLGGAGGSGKLTYVDWNIS